jgi:hypothetical protein
LNVSILIKSQNISFAVPIATFKTLKPDLAVEGDARKRWARILSKQLDELVQISRSALASLTSDQLPFTRLSGWKFRQAPKSMMTCHEGFDEPEGLEHKIRVSTDYCYNALGAHLLRSLDGGLYEIHRQVIDGLPGSTPMQKIKIAEAYYNRFNFANPEAPYVEDMTYVNQYTCDRSIVKNKQKLSFYITMCRRDFVRYPGIQDVDMKISSVRVDRPIFTTHFRALGMESASVEKIISALINDVSYEDFSEMVGEK